MVDFEDPIELINVYISMFVYDFSQINDRNTITKFGKHFDPMDGQRFLDGICAVDYAASNNFNTMELFSKALSPLTLNSEGLHGVSVRLLLTSFPLSASTDLANPVNQMLEEININPSTVDDQVNILRKLTPFYRTVKSVYIFIFLRNSNDMAEVSEAQKSIKEFSAWLLENNRRLALIATIRQSHVRAKDLRLYFLTVLLRLRPMKA